MSDADPFETLGLDASATATDVRRARRELAKHAHPDLGGSHARMQELNDAASAALAMLEERSEAASDAEPSPSIHHLRVTEPIVRRVGRWIGHDESSFVVHCLPAEAFESLLVVASWIGEVVDDDPPYRLDLLLTEPGECFCRLDLAPDAGASTVSISLAHIDGAPWPPPTLDEVRDALVAGLNGLE
ncbi:MAG: hypothetical protein AB7V43_07690 [Acidimicrobiia bacterium]